MIHFNFFSVHVSLANFIDTMIDYPMSQQYAFQMFERLGAIGVMTEEQVRTYKLHVENLQSEEEEV